MSLESLKNRLVGELSGASRTVIDNEFLSVTKEFCRKTRAMIHKETFTAALSHTFTPPVHTRAARVVAIWVDSVRHIPVNKNTPFSTLPARTFDFDPVEGVITLPEDATGSALAHVAILPTAMGGISTSFIEEYEDALFDGTMARMLTHNKRPYSNAAMGIMHGRRYSAAVARVRRSMISAYARADAGWTFPLATRSRSLR